MNPRAAGGGGWTDGRRSHSVSEISFSRRRRDARPTAKCGTGGGGGIGDGEMRIEVASLSRGYGGIMQPKAVKVSANGFQGQVGQSCCFSSNQPMLGLKNGEQLGKSSQNDDVSDTLLAGSDECDASDRSAAAGEWVQRAVYQVHVSRDRDGAGCAGRTRV